LKHAISLARLAYARDQGAPGGSDGLMLNLLLYLALIPHFIQSIPPQSTTSSNSALELHSGTCTSNLPS
jgi:hypothetical protein